MLARRIFPIAAAAALAAWPLAAAGGPAPRRGKPMLETLNRSHPRLMLTEKRLADLKSLRASDPLLDKCVGDVIAQADQALAAPRLEHKLIGPRLLSVSRECLRRVYTLGVAWRFTGKREYADALRDNLLTVCAFRDWNPSHYLDTAEMAHAVGIGYDWLFNALDEPTRQRVRRGLLDKALSPQLAARNADQPWWAGSAFNWNQVCNGGLAVAALAVADSDPAEAEYVLARAVRTMPKALATYEPDGAWGEGPGYWNYATRYTVFGLAAMQTALGTDFGLSDRRGLSLAGDFPIYAAGPTGLFVNFADVGERGRRGTEWPLFWLAGRYGRSDYAADERACLADHRAAPEHVIWYQPAPANAPPPRPLDRLFGGQVELALFRSAWGDPTALFASIKAGDNQVNHAHLDLGQFELDALGVRWARDLGSDDYNLPGYWDKGPKGRRWTYYRLGSLSHNVPLIDGRNQHAAGKARMSKFSGGGDAPFAIVDFTSAYKDQASRARRGLRLYAGRRAVLVQDEFDLAGRRELAWGMTTDAVVELAEDGRSATLTLEGKRLTASLAAAPAGARFTVESAERKAPEKPNTGARRLMVRIAAAAGPVRVAVALTPHWPNGKPAPLPAVQPLADWKSAD